MGKYLPRVAHHDLVKLPRHTSTFQSPASGFQVVGVTEEQTRYGPAGEGDGPVQTYIGVLGTQVDSSTLLSPVLCAVVWA